MQNPRGRRRGATSVNKKNNREVGDKPGMNLKPNTATPNK